jgi:hypothetical protein
MEASTALSGFYASSNSSARLTMSSKPRAAGGFATRLSLSLWNFDSVNHRESV